MKKLLNIYILFWVLCPFFTTAQTWASYSAQLPTKDYWGHKFKFSASVKTDELDQKAAAQLWVRVDKPTQGSAFFDNMKNKPIKAKEWKTYSIEGVIDSNTTKIAFGALSDLNGLSYYDNMKLEVETSKDTWKTVYFNDFEQDKHNLQEGIQLPLAINNGKNTNFTASLEKKGENQYLKIEGRGVIDFGKNEKVGKYADANGVKLYYEIYGSGEPLVILQGTTSSIARMSLYYPELIKKYQVILVDNRGIGNSTDTDQPFTYETMASDINQLLEQLHIDSALVWGCQDGSLGLHLAKNYPKKVKKLLTFGLRIQKDSSAIPPSTLTMMEKRMNEIQDPLGKKILALEIRRDYPNIPFSELSSIKVPVLVIGADKGSVVKEHTLKISRSLPKGQFCYLPGFPNEILFNKSDLFLIIMKNFFDE
jgi:pimeloyl-ACP methyl ester carboxylesterase